MQERLASTTQVVAHHGCNERVGKAVVSIALYQVGSLYEFVECIERLAFAAPACLSKCTHVEVAVENRSSLEHLTGQRRQARDARTQEFR